MTSSDDASRDDPGSRPDVPLDEEAAWLAIVANYGDRPVLDDDPTDDPIDVPTDGDADGEDGRTPPEPTPVELRDPVTEHPSRAAAHEREHDHFVPPEPPPLPRPTPARRLAWSGLFLPPLLLLAAVLFGWTFPEWLSVLLVMSFVGGFGFLVATMPRDRGDGWDDGAVV